MYEPLPTLTYHWNPNQAPSNGLSRHVSTRKHGQSFDLGPHPADPLSTVSPGSPTTAENGVHTNDASTERRSVVGQELYVHYGNGGCASEPSLLVMRVLRPRQDFHVLEIHDRDTSVVPRDEDQLHHK